MPAEESGPSDGDPSESDVHGNVIPAEHLRTDLSRVIDELGHQPTTAEYDEEGDYSFVTVANRLGDGKWYEAIRAAGHEPTTHTGSKIPEAKLRADLARVFDEVGEMPTMVEYDELGEFTAETVALPARSGPTQRHPGVGSAPRSGRCFPECGGGGGVIGAPVVAILPNNSPLFRGVCLVRRAPRRQRVGLGVLTRPCRPTCRRIRSVGDNHPPARCLSFIAQAGSDRH